MTDRNKDIPTETEISIQFRRIIENLEIESFPGLVEQAEKLLTEAGLKAKYHSVRGHLRQVDDLSGSTGLDIGCGYGLPILLMRLMGAGRLEGCDVLPERIAGARHWLTQTDLTDIRFQNNPADRIPLSDASVDWVTAIGLYANLNMDATARLFESIRKVLRPGGLLLLNESTNSYYPPVRDAILTRFQREESPEGLIFEERRDYISRYTTALSQERADILTKETCYFFGVHLDQAINRYLSDGISPNSRFDPTDLTRPPLRPVSGNVVMRPCDYGILRNELETAGFDVSFRTPMGDRILDRVEERGYFAAHRGVFAVARAV